MTGPDRVRHSALYLPASNPRAIAKARALPVDVVILDLEDAVAPESKAVARAQAVSAVAEGGFGRRELVVRVNALDTPWGAADLAALAGGKVDAILVPKVGDARDVANYVAALDEATPIWTMVETAKSLFHLDELAAVPAVAALVLGTNDLARELRADPGSDRLPFHGFLASTVAAARAHGRVALDGVYNAIDDAPGFAAQCDQAVRFGFDGKTLIHPGQVDVCNAAFAPDPDKIAWATAIVDAFAGPGGDKGAIRVDGAMVERLHLDQARAILAAAARVRN